MKGKAEGKLRSVVRAERFELTDKEVKVRAGLSMGFQGETPQLDLFDLERNLHITLSLGGPLGASLSFVKNKKARAALAMDLDGHPTLMLFDKNQNIRAAVLVGPEGDPRVELHDQAGNLLWTAP